MIETLKTLSRLSRRLRRSSAFFFGLEDPNHEVDFFGSKGSSVFPTRLVSILSPDAFARATVSTSSPLASAPAASFVVTGVFTCVVVVVVVDDDDLCALVMTSVGCSSFSEMTVVVPSGLRRTLRTILFTTRFFRLPVSASTMTSPMESDASIVCSGPCPRIAPSRRVP